MHKHFADSVISVALAVIVCAAGERVVMAAPTPNKIINVLICQGATARSYVACLQACNEQNLFPGFEFRWEVLEYLKASDLEGKHVVMYPGGTVYAQKVDIPALQAFVRAGGGYYGTCAGAYAAIDDFALTPQVKGKAANFQGCVDIRMTDWGTRVFGYGGNLIVRCFNGPALYDPTDVATPCAFWDRNHQGDRPRYGERSWKAQGDKPAYTETRAWQVEFDRAKCGDKYMQSYADRLGKGWVVVVNAHPEIGKDRGYWFPRWVGAGVLWAAGRGSALDGYHLGFDQGMFDESHKRFTANDGNLLISQRDFVSESGTITAISALLGEGAGRVIVGVYEGETRPERCIAQSAPTPAAGKFGWQSIPLTAPLPAKKGQTIWLSILLQNKEQKTHFARFPDVKGQTFEDRVWASPVEWKDLRDGRLPDAPAGSIQDHLMCLFAHVRFQNSVGKQQ